MSCSRRPTSRPGSTTVLGWAREHLAELEVTEKIRDDVREGMDKRQREFLLREQLAAIRKELGEGEPEGADDYRARVEAAELPDKVREAALREVGKLERASDQSPESGWIRTWLDTVLDLPWSTRTDDNTDIAGAREILDADHHGLDDVKDRIVEYLAVRARRAERGLGGRRRPRLGRRAGARRPARRRQDLAGRVGRARPRPQVRPRRPRRRARRGRDPRPPAHLRRRAARPHRPGHHRGRLDEPGRAARRDRQGRLGLPRRPGGGPARGARPGAEPHVPRPLPRGRPRPVRRAVPGDRQRRRHHPGRAARPHGGRDARRLHRGGQGRHRADAPAAAPARRAPRCPRTR